MLRLIFKKMFYEDCISDACLIKAGVNKRALANESYGNCRIPSHGTPIEFNLCDLSMR